MTAEAAVSKQKLSPVLLNWTEHDGTITVTPRDESRFNIKLNKAIEILRQADRRDSFGEQFNLLVKELVVWLRERDDIEAAYLTIRDGGLVFVVVRNSPRFNEELEDAISDLAIQITSDVDLDLIALNVMTLPPASDEAIETFLSEECTMRIPNAEGDRPHHAGE